MAMISIIILASFCNTLVFRFLRNYGKRVCIKFCKFNIATCLSNL